jgi:hypothetical protein
MVLRGSRPATVVAAFACAVGLALPAAGASAAAPAPVPAGVVGMNFSGVLFPDTSPGINLNAQMGAMVASGVQSIRAVFDWSYAQPYSSWSQVPPAETSQFTDVGGIPTRFGVFDALVKLAAKHGLTVLPTVLYTPLWDAAPSINALSIPQRDAPYAAFCAALVRRYGPHGTFWRTNSPAVPIRMWQIWNEPNLEYYWPKQPFAASYVALLRAAHQAIKAADPGAKVVLGGLPDISWESLKTVYAIPGARKLFDVVALHPYTKQPQGVITILRYVRQVMVAAGDSDKPMIADEISWPSSVGHDATSEFDIGTTEAGQARKTATVMALLASNRRSLHLIGFDYYTWATPDDNGGNQFDFAGLFKYSSGRLTPKPAFAAFRKAALALEHCRKRGREANVCARPG